MVSRQTPSLAATSAGVRSLLPPSPSGREQKSCRFGVGTEWAKVSVPACPPSPCASWRTGVTVQEDTGRDVPGGSGIVEGPDFEAAGQRFDSSQARHRKSANQDDSEAAPKG